jgi:hypothetical protein
MAFLGHAQQMLEGTIISIPVVLVKKVLLLILLQQVELNMPLCTKK